MGASFVSGPLEFPLGGEPEASANGSDPVGHVALALARLPQQFRFKDNIAKLLETLVEPFASLETAFQQLLNERSIETAAGAQLDVIGILVGERSRNGALDDTYRRRIKARISTNRSSGLIEEYITISKLVVSDDAVRFVLERQNHATIVVNVEDAAITHEIAAILIAFLKDATPGGARVILEYGTAEPLTTWFRFDTGPGFDQGILATSVD